jgi:hypothetical protein
MMTMTKTLTLAEARALAARLQAEQDAADAAETAARDAKALEIYTAAFEQECPQYRLARDEAAAVIDQLAAADPAPGISDVWNGFVNLRELDAKAGSMGTFASMIESVAPLPDNAIGAKMGRPPGVAELYANLGFAQFADAIITRRAERIRRTHLSELQTAAYEAIAAAGQATRAAPTSPLSKPRWPR